MRALSWGGGRGALLVGAVLLGAGCADGGVKIFGGDSGGGLFSDDTGGGGGGGGGSCDEEVDTSAPGGPGCLSGTISCGGTLVGSTVGGSEEMGAELYQSAFCFVPFEDYDGPERVYELILPADTQATLDVDFPCADMVFAALKWSDEDSCPSGDGHGIISCEGGQLGGGGSYTISPWDGETRWLLVVDAPAGTEDQFELTVSCEEA